MQTPESPSSAQVDREWRMLTEAIRREVQAGNQEVIAGLHGVLLAPLRETLARETIGVLGTHIERLAERYRGTLGAYFDEPPVEDVLLKPDLRSATEGFPSAISAGRAGRIARRYAMARDLKLLALAAELSSESLPPADATGDRRLESGVVLTVDPGHEAEIGPLLLDPRRWDRRVQLKDRVYAAAFREDGRLFILKERKTARHLDTRKGGHVDGLTSREEYAVTRNLHAHGEVSRGGVHLTWEQPLGCVEFPDGYSLTVFACQEGLSETADIPDLARRICLHRSRFEEEFARIGARARRLRFDRRVDGVGRANLPLLRRWLLPVATPPTQATLTFEEFALAKALWMAGRARGLFHDAIAAQGYRNLDGNVGVAVLPPQGDEPELRFLGYDVEYFQALPSPVPERERRQVRRNLLASHARCPMPSSYDDAHEGHRDTTPLQRAVYLAFLEEEQAGLR